MAYLILPTALTILVGGILLHFHVEGVAIACAVTFLGVLIWEALEAWWQTKKEIEDGEL